MPQFRIRKASELLGVSDDTVRRWIDSGSLPASKDDVGRKVNADGVMAQVDVQCGPQTVVSLMSSEAAREMQLEPGRLAVAMVKATTVIIETPGGSS
jgi:molybdopterin-binding protein